MCSLFTMPFNEDSGVIWLVRWKLYPTHTAYFCVRELTVYGEKDHFLLAK